MQAGSKTGSVNRSYRKTMGILLLVVAVILLISLHEDGYFPVIHSPKDVFEAIGLWFRLTFGKIFHTSDALNYYDLTAEVPWYGAVIERVRITVMTFLCGALMALSGSIFQTVFRNPMAAPTMLGVSSGVQVGVVILVLQYEFAATTMLLYKYIYCYIGAVAMLLLVLGAGKLTSGRGKLNIFDMLLVGAILSQIVGAVMSYFTYGMDNDLALVFQQVSGAIEMDTSKEAFMFLGAVVIVSLIPMMLLRYSFNAVGFETDDTRSLGINAYAMKIVTMILGTIMIAAAMIHCGSAGMISMAAPFIARGLFGAEYRRQFWGNLLIGGTILVMCKDIVGMIPFFGSHIPLGTVVDFVVLPIFIVIVVSQRRVWT